MVAVSLLYFPFGVLAVVFFMFYLFIEKTAYVCVCVGQNPIPPRGARW